TSQGFAPSGVRPGEGPEGPAVTFAQRPLVFERNDGQTDATVRFLARAPGCRLFVRDADAVLSLRGGGSSVRVAFDGAQSPRAEGLQPLRGFVNYVIGAERSLWRSGVPTF